MHKFKIILAAVSVFIFSSGTALAVEFQNPLQINTVEDFVSNALTSLNGIIGFVAVLFIVIGGIMYMLAAGDEKKITAAKNTITAAVIGFAITIGAGTFLKEVSTILGYTSNNAAVTNAVSLVDIVKRTLDLLLSIVGIIAIIGMVVGGFFYLTAYGDEKKAETGKKIATSSIIGIAIALAALMIVQLVVDLIQGGGVNAL